MSRHENDSARAAEQEPQRLVVSRKRELARGDADGRAA